MKNIPGKISFTRQESVQALRRESKNRKKMMKQKATILTCFYPEVTVEKMRTYRQKQ